MFVENILKTTADKDMPNIVKCLVHVENFQHVSVDVISRKSFKFKMLAIDAGKLLDPDVWPEGIGCRLWQFQHRNLDGEVQKPVSTK